jgi:hypothetical protein
MKLHIWHKWESDGFESYGYFTRFFKKCPGCGSRWDGISGNRPENLNMSYVYLFVVPLWVVGIVIYMFHITPY